MGNTIVSNFWTALIASAVLVITALLLDGHSEVGKILIMEGAAFGLRLGDQAAKAYNQGRVERMREEIKLKRRS